RSLPDALPISKLTKEPGSMSPATISARVLRSTRSSRSILVLCSLFTGGQGARFGFDGHQHVGVNRRGHNVFWIQGTGGQDLFDLHNGLFGGGGHDRAEVPGGLAVDEVALLVSLE